MNLMEWAKREVDIAISKEAPDRKNGEFDYGAACYESALEILQTIANQGHSGMSIGFTMSILNKLVKYKPLTPIDDIDSVWNYSHRIKEIKADCYQCNRLFSLFKYVYDDGRVEYHDNDRLICIDIDSGNSYSNGFVKSRIRKEIPKIEFPYQPESKPYRIYCSDCLVDPKNGDFDTIYIGWYVTPDGKEIKIDEWYTWKENEFIKTDPETVYELKNNNRECNQTKYKYDKNE